MERQIKFRGKRVRTHEWVYGHLFQNPVGEWKIKKGFREYLVKPDTIGQFTGLTDSAGKEIYEGDILSTDLAKSSCEVMFRNGCFVLCLNDGEEDFYDILAPLEDSVAQTKYHAIIGNIHDNPELIPNQPTAI